MASDRERKDPQDQDFGGQAASDQVKVDKLEAAGVPEQEMPDSARESPRAAGKAEPSD
jgi:hypothetical protein